MPKTKVHTTTYRFDGIQYILGSTRGLVLKFSPGQSTADKLIIYIIFCSILY